MTSSILGPYFFMTRNLMPYHIDVVCQKWIHMLVKALYYQKSCRKSFISPKIHEPL